MISPNTPVEIRSSRLTLSGSLSWMPPRDQAYLREILQDQAIPLLAR